MKNQSNSPGSETRPPINELVPKWVNLNLVIQDISFFVIGLIAALIVGWAIFPALLYSKQPQPMNFNHALHLNSEIVDGIEGDTPEEKCEMVHMGNAHPGQQFAFFRGVKLQHGQQLPGAGLI